jgi:hypothetical protein
MRPRSLIDRKVGERSDEIAETFVDTTIDSNMTGARIVVSVSGADKAPTEKKRMTRTKQFIQELASEPEWPDDEEWDKHPGETWVDGRWVTREKRMGAGA